MWRLMFRNKFPGLGKCDSASLPARSAAPTELWVTFFRPELVQTGLEVSLRKLQLSYVDLYLIHFPVALKVLEKCTEAGLTKSIGMSNCNRRQLEMMLKKPALKHKPVCNQKAPC
ncbi:aldo-keto reductase family 1 member C4-like isoform 2-T2 [Hipposideros larvatus]